MNARIPQALTRVHACEAELMRARERLKQCRQLLQDAVATLYREIHDEANGVQDLPFGDGDPTADAGLDQARDGKPRRRSEKAESR